MAGNVIASFEIQADSPARAVAFYGAVFGWEFERAPELPIEYWRLTGAVGLQGAILQRPVPPPGPMHGTNAYVCSIMVDDFDATAATVMAHGGQVAMAKFGVPGRCWQGYFLDPEGNTFGVFEVDETVT